MEHCGSNLITIGPSLPGNSRSTEKANRKHLRMKSHFPSCDQRHGWKFQGPGIVYCLCAYLIHSTNVFIWRVLCVSRCATATVWMMRRSENSSSSVTSANVKTWVGATCAPSPSPWLGPSVSRYATKMSETLEICVKVRDYTLFIS